MNEPRTLHKLGPTAKRDLREILRGLWIGELLRPSASLILAAPTLADTPLLDNRAGDFTGLEPAWGERVLGLSELVVRNLVAGGKVHVVTRAEAGASSPEFLDRLRRRADDVGQSARLTTSVVESLSPVGWAGAEFVLSGGLHFGESEVDFAEEAVALTVGEDARTGIEKFQRAYGGLQP